MQTYSIGLLMTVLIDYKTYHSNKFYYLHQSIENTSNEFTIDTSFL